MTRRLAVAADLHRIEVPTLVIGAEQDATDPEHMRWMAGEISNARYLHCPEECHLATYDDRATFFDGLIGFIDDVNAGRL